MSSAEGDFAPGRLWSLWDMLGKYAAAYIFVVETLDKTVRNLQELAKLTRSSEAPGLDIVTLAMLGKENPVPRELLDQISDSLKAIAEQLATRMPFPSVEAQRKRIHYAIDDNSGPVALAGLIAEMRTRLVDELAAREFLYIPPERVRFYDDPMLFGKDVNELFPLAIDDIEEAGKCLAVGQGTACVLHTMRVLEVGLKALAKSLNIPYAPSWESYLKQIADNIAMKHKNKTAKWKKDEKFYRDVSGDLLTVKQVWRNPTMHVDRKYSAEEAEQIFTAANSVMNRIASHFSAKELEKLEKMIG
jgi:hypothetical protein